jgi:hypothetical protein
MPRKPAKIAPAMPVKIPRAGYETAKRLSELASLHGWSCLGIERTDLPTVAAIVEEALYALEKRAKVKR